MSKQVSLSAAVSALTMALFAVTAMLGGFAGDEPYAGSHTSALPAYTVNK